MTTLSARLSVRSLARPTPRANLLTIEAPPSGFWFRAGQAVWLARPGQALRRIYSIASAPEDLARHGVLEFLVGLDEDGPPGSRLAEVAPGDPIEVEGPLGGIDLPPGHAAAPGLLVAGGTGIAPLRSIWRHLLAHPPAPPIAVVYSARVERDFAFVSELRALAADGRLALTLTVTREDPGWHGERGRVTAAMLGAHLDDPRRTRCAVCGPPGFVDHVTGTLRTMGVSPESIGTERW